jgi:hypothetical protein
MPEPSRQLQLTDHCINDGDDDRRVAPFTNQNQRIEEEKGEGKRVCEIGILSYSSLHYVERRLLKNYLSSTKFQLHKTVALKMRNGPPCFERRKKLRVVRATEAFPCPQYLPACPYKRWPSTPGCSCCLEPK